MKKKLLVPVCIAIFILGILTGYVLFRKNVVIKDANVEKQTFRQESSVSDDLSTFNRLQQLSSLFDGQELKQIINVPLGEEIAGASVKFKIIKAEYANSLNDGYSNTPAKNGAKYLLVHCVVTNTTAETFWGDFSNIPVIDSKNRSFVESDKYMYTKEYLSDRKLSPDIPESGVLVYDVPLDIETPQLAMHKGGTGDVYVFDLEL